MRRHSGSFAGRQLKKLRVYATDNIPMDQIFTLCPNLNLLSYNDYLDQVTVASDIKSDTLSQLTVLDLSFCNSVSGHRYGPEALLQLLQAPKLRLLRLSMISVDQQDVDEIIQRLKQQEILQNLEYAHLFPSVQYSNLNDVMFLIEQIKCLHSNMVFHCPKLNASWENVVFH